MFQVLGSATSATTAHPAVGSREDRDADRGIGAVGQSHPEVDAALERESVSGVEWLPRHKPHRWI
ncbi:hypothetical protein [Patulibacter minatonensis]|uniref:hypothetical protein n=1 Tax=Patulibacter minatonensis TaxID=298163 RepID=UPI00047BD1A1|nr:hypothetical protein [Patulibacter minatonensis]